MPEARVNGTTIGFDDVGDGPPLVLLHGLGLDRTMWGPQVERFRRTHRVVTPDARGAGASGTLAAGVPVLATQAADVDALLEHLGVERAVVVGVSFGGVLAQELALRHPHRVAGLVVADSFGDTRLAGRARRLGLVLGTWLAVPLLLLPAGLTAPAVARTYARWPLARAQVLRGYRRLRRRETARVRLALNRVDTVSRLGGLSCPVLGLVGDASPELVELMTRLVDAAPRARLEVVPDSFDPGNLCRPDVFDALVEDFLAELAWTAGPS